MRPVLRLLELVDGYYDPHARRAYPLTERPTASDLEAVALTLAEVRPVFEGCYVDRCLVLFGHPRIFTEGGDRLWPGLGPERRRILTRHDPALLRRMKRIANLHPDVVRDLQSRATCTPRAHVEAAMVQRIAGHGAKEKAKQLLALAAAVGRKPRKRA